MKTRVTTIKKIVLVGFLFSVFVVTPIITSAAAIKNAGKNGLVGYWTMNEGVGTRADDVSGYKNNGTLVNSPSWVAGKIGKALSFNGTNSYVAVPSIDSSGTNVVSVSWWMYKSSFNNSISIIAEASSNFNVSTTGWVIGPDDNTGYFAVGLRGNVGYSIGYYNRPSPLMWHHYVALFDKSKTSNEVSFYIDGVLQTAASYANNNNNTNNFGNDVFYMGMRAGAQYPLAGKVDDMRIYNRLLTSYEILDLYKAGGGTTIKSIASGRNGLVGYWPMNEYAGSEINDASGNKNNGLISSASWVAGKFGKALSFNGSFSYVDAGNKIDTSNITAMTISAWVYNNAVAANKGIAGWWNGTNGIFIQNETAATDGVVFIAGGGTSFGTVNYTTVNRWTHVTLVYDGSLTGDANRLKGYVDGVQRTLSFAGGVVPASFATSGNFIIGNVNTLSRYWNGKIDEVKVYNRALSSIEVLDLYKSGGQTIISASKNDLITNGLVGLWSFDGKDMNWGANKVLDRSGRGNDGTLVGMSTTSSPVIGKIGQGIKLNSNYAVSGGVFSDLGTANKPYTISTWAKLSPGTTEGTIVHVSSVSTGGGWCLPMIALSTNKFVINSWKGSLSSATSNTTAVADTWYHLVHVWDSNGLRIYVNGVLENTTVQATFSASGGSNYLWTGYRNVACFGTPSTDFIGAVDDIRVYSRALSATEIKQLYNTGR